jgi:hypothetical protein
MPVNLKKSVQSSVAPVVVNQASTRLGSSSLASASSKLRWADAYKDSTGKEEALQPKKKEQPTTARFTNFSSALASVPVQGQPHGKSDSWTDDALQRQTNRSSKKVAELAARSDSAGTYLPQHLDVARSVIAKSRDVVVPVTHQEMSSLLQDFCKNIFVNQTENSLGRGHIVLELGAIMPGARVEMIRNGSFLHVRLFANDKKSLQLMESGRQDLVRGLSGATRLRVSVETIAHESESHG